MESGTILDDSGVSKMSEGHTLSGNVVRDQGVMHEL